jgi:hypothetical protein
MAENSWLVSASDNLFMAEGGGRENRKAVTATLPESIVPEKERESILFLAIYVCIINEPRRSPRE